MADPYQPVRERLIEAALPHVAFDGWTEGTFGAAMRDADVNEAEARAGAPRGALDLAAAYHRMGDARMRERLRVADLHTMRIRDKIAFALRARIEAIDDREAVRRGAALYALPHLAPEGARLIWGTADAIWEAIGDKSRDSNWYTKRATLSAVYGSTVLYWLGDDTPGHAATWDFIDRRIEDVMAFEKVKARVRENPVARTILAGPLWALSQVRAPMRPPSMAEMPGYFAGSPPAPTIHEDGVIPPEGGEPRP